VPELKENGEIEKGGLSNLKSCGYSQTKPHIQNRDGWKNDKYNYSSKQYLERRCRTFKKQEFNFLSNSFNSSEFLTECTNNLVDCSMECEQITCGKKGYSSCKANNCKAVYKKSNPRFSIQGAVSGGSRVNRLKYQTRLTAQSTRHLVSGVNNENVTSMSTNSANGFGNAVNGIYPVSLYRSTYPTYKSNLGGLCVGKSRTINGRSQSCKMSDDCSRMHQVNGLN